MAPLAHVLQLPGLDSKLFLEVGGGIANGDLILTGDFGAIYVSRLSLNGVTASHGAFEKNVFSAAVVRNLPWGWAPRFELQRHRFQLLELRIKMRLNTCSWHAPRLPFATIETIGGTASRWACMSFAKLSVAISGGIMIQNMSCLAKGWLHSHTCCSSQSLLLNGL